MSTPTIPRILQISIHALRKESDNIDMMVINSLEISIHALRKESDARPSFPHPQESYFNPRSP